MTLVVCRSTDSGAPALSGAAGRLTDVLQAVLVDGYGSTPATATITSNGTNVSNGDTVTVDGVTYTFKTALTPAANEVLIGASAAASLTNLVAAINLYGTSGTTYGAGTQTPPGVWASAVTSTVITLSARKGGSGGNSLAIAKSAATLTLSGSTLSGGSGSNTLGGAGWTNPYNGNGGQRVFRPGSGVQHYFHFDDASPSTSALGKEAQFRGSEGATGFQSGITNYFPTTAQVALGSGLRARKSSSTDNTSRAWIVIADDRTCFVMVLTNDAANTYFPIMFGEIYSIYAGTDLYRSMVIGHNVVNSASIDTFANSMGTAGFSALAGHYMPRAYTAIGGSINNAKFGDVARGALNGTSSPFGSGGLVVPNGVDGNLHISPIHVCETGMHVRGRTRGLFHLCHVATGFADGDTITGAGAYAGRTFLIVKGVQGSGGGNGCLCFDITGTWETN